MRQGYSNTQACRIVGVDRRTGQKWRNGRRPTGTQRTWMQPMRIAPEPSRTGRYLCEAERIHIADRLREKASLRAIAAELGRSPSTVSREVRRNRQPATGRYRPFAAQARADARRPRPRPGKIATQPDLRAFIQARLDEWWSPQQICHALREHFPARPEMHVVHETIYQALYVQGRGELRRELATALRTGRTRRTPRRQTRRRRPRFTDPMVMISRRPAEAEDRAVPGHWEGDLIIGRDGASQIGTLVERATRYVMLLHLPAGRTAEEVRDALTATVQTLPAHLKRSLTWDQGSEMAAHKAFTTATNIPVYFCDPASPWQRGSNENTNGLLRQYFPKGTDLSVHTPQHLAHVAAQLNGRPRQTLGWETPAQRLHKLLTT
jgi:IS30 family transposase